MTFIHNEARYEAAIQRRIKANAAKSRGKRWMAAHPDAERLIDWLNQCGEFAAKCSCGQSHSDMDDGYYNEDTCKMIHHPACRGMFAGGFGDFLLKLRDDIHGWGGLSDKQTQIVRDALKRAEGFAVERDAKFEAMKAQDAANSQWIGEVGKRQDFELEVRWVKEFSGQYGMSYIHGLKDKAGNVIIYKGSNKLGNKGHEVKVKATIKAHSERDGVKQTQIARPKLAEGQKEWWEGRVEG